MKQEILPLWPGKEDCGLYTLTRYVREYDPCGNALRPAILVVPGGGYSGVCRSTEGLPIANRFLSLGFQPFILQYHVAPHRYPLPQQDLFRAIQLIRLHAAEWHVSKIAVVGFSAGGHLAACAGTLFEDIRVSAGDAADALSARPDALMLAYPVITFIGNGHFASGRNLCGEKYEEMKAQMSLETRVTARSVPAFIWHTAQDQAVPVDNSLLFFQALREHQVPAELHIFPFGAHGKALGYGWTDIGQWPEQAKEFCRHAAGFSFPSENDGRRILYLTFDDTVKFHLTTVAPLLKKCHFGATFFLPAFSGKERTACPEDAPLLPGEIRQLHEMGFDLGNSTWTHPDLSRLSPAQIEQEITRSQEFFADLSLPLPVAFAYPDGVFDTEASGHLGMQGITCARTTERGGVTPETDPLRIPARALRGECFEEFRAVVDGIAPGCAACVAFQGVWKPDALARCMDYLLEQQIAVCPLRWDAGF